MRKSASRSIAGKLFLFLIVAGLSSGFYLYRAEPDFLLNRYYETIYSGRLQAEPEVSLNEKPISFKLSEYEWTIKKNNGQWYTPPANSGHIGGASGSDAAISSINDKLKVRVDKQPDQVSLKIIETDSGQTVLEEPFDLSELPLPKKNGSFTYELTMEWSAEARHYRGKAILEIPVTVEVPAQFIFSRQKVEQGQLLEALVYYAGQPEDVLFEQSIYSKFKWYSGEGFLRGYLPTNYNVKPGTYQIKYGIKSQGTEFTQPIEVVEHNYHIQYLTVDSKTEAETRNDEAYAEYNKYYIPVRNHSEPDRYYTDSFIIPVKGRLTTEFGETRYVNDQPTSYRHLGLDIAAPAGTDVKSANRGKVVLARPFILTGNTVMLDHGEGLFSVYHHMLNIAVKTGDIVERGQKIGEVGSTGFSTGAHLHFMISYYRANLEPGYFLVGQPITYDNYQKFLQ